MTELEHQEFSRILFKKLFLASVAYAGDDPAVLPIEYQVTDAESAFFEKWLPYRQKLSSERFIKEQEQENNNEQAQAKD
jgi:hypothetical protein